VEKALTYLVGHPEKGGHYFTVWAPRQTGKTWLMRQVVAEIPVRYGDRFAVCHFSLGAMPEMDDKSAIINRTLPQALQDILEMRLPGHPLVKDWKEFSQLFSYDRGLWDRPLLLLLDEIDIVQPALLDVMVRQFRELYLDRANNWLHGLALIGVRAMLGVESRHGSPFNIQRSLHVPNLTQAEVEDLYQQYQEESGQAIEPVVVEEVYRVTRGQPGLVSWFGELLTEKYNPGRNKVLDMDLWEEVYLYACRIEFNNTVLNIITKARTEYRPYVLELFTNPNVEFSFDADWCNYMYMHGLIDQEKITTETGEPRVVCRFAAPFIQLRVYNALTYDLVEDPLPLLALDPLDDLADVFAEPTLNLPALLERYKGYLIRLQAKGLNSWQEQPRRKRDLQLTEAVGHFHLHAWLKTAVGRRCVISPEFPTGNGKVDLHLRCVDQQGLIEVKSFIDVYQLRRDREHAAQYARQLGLDRLTMAVFIPVADETVLEKLSGMTVIDGVHVTVVAISWL
jgi:hypothetical protein